MKRTRTAVGLSALYALRHVHYSSSHSNNRDLQHRIAARVSSTESFRVLRQAYSKIKGPASTNLECAESCLAMFDESSVPCTYCGSISFGSMIHGAVRMQKRAADKFGPRNYPVPESHAIQTKMSGLISIKYHPALVKLWAGADDSMVEQSLYVNIKRSR